MVKKIKKNKVVFIVGTLHAGGIERSVSDWCIYLNSQTDWVPEVICLIKRNGIFLNNLKNSNINVHECRLNNLFFIFRFFKLLRTIKPNVLHSQVAFSMPRQVIAAKIAGISKIVFTQQNDYRNWDLFWSNLRLKLYFKLFSPFINDYTCVSMQVRDNLSKLSGMKPQYFKIVPNGVNTARFHSNTIPNLKVKTKLGIEKDCFLLGMVGRFSVQKGHIYLLEAVKMIPSTCKIHLLLVGAGELKEQMLNFVNSNGLNRRVSFWEPTIDVQDILPGLDAFILSSLWEGMPLALLEAMSCALPVISTSVAGTKDLIRNYDNGLLIPPGDIESIMKAIIFLMDNPLEAIRMGISAKSIVHNQFSVEHNVKSYIKLYES